MSKKDRHGIMPIFGTNRKGRTKAYQYTSRFKSGQMVLQELQDRIDRELKNGPCKTIEVTEEMRKKYDRK